MVSQNFIIISLRMEQLLVKYKPKEKILIYITRKSIGCHQNGDLVSKNDEICHICIRWLKSLL